MHADTEEEGKRDMRQMDLFSDRIMTIDWNDFLRCHKDFAWFKTTSHLGTQFEGEIMQYYNLQYGEDNPPLYLADPLNASITGKTTFHCLIISFNDGDSVFFAYRSLEFMKKRIHVFDVPISLHRDENHSRMVIDELMKTGFVTFIFKEKYKSYFQCFYPKEQYNDYYYDLEIERQKCFDNSRWTRKHCINALKKNTDYSVVCIGDDDRLRHLAIECRKAWFERHRGDRKMDNEKKYFENSLKFNDNRVVNLALVFQNSIVLGVKTMLVRDDKGYATDILYSHVSRNRRELFESNSSLNNGVLSNIDECMRYATGTYLLNRGIHREYRLGFIPGNTTLHQHKERIATGKICYFSTVKEK